MGGTCAKLFSTTKHRKDRRKEEAVIKESSKLPVKQVTSSKRNDIPVDKGRLSGDRAALNDAKANCSARPKITTVPKSIEGKHVAAEWPSWLAKAAGEAIKGMVPLRPDSFEIIKRIGKGGYSTVYLGRDLVTDKLFALKKLWFDDDNPECVKLITREIVTLRRLDHPNIIKLEGLVIKPSRWLGLVLEYMEYDLSTVRSLHPDLKLTEPQIKCYMQQLFRGLDYCHSRGVLHRDIKTANLLVNNKGILKIADFGFSNFFDNTHHQRVPLTSRIVTLWYRPPELLMGAEAYGVEVDLWSAGCVLGELFVGKPILPGRTEVDQMHKIFKLCGSLSEDYCKKSRLPIFKPLQPYKRCLAETFNHLPAAAVGLMETLLSMEPDCRGTAALALRSEFVMTEPFACDPISLPNKRIINEIDKKAQEVKRKEQEGKEARKHVQESKEMQKGLGLDGAYLSGSVNRNQGHHPGPNSQGEPSIKLDEDKTASAFTLPSRGKAPAVEGKGKDFWEDARDWSFTSNEDKRKQGFSGPLVTHVGSSRSHKADRKQGFSGPLVTHVGSTRSHKADRKQGFSGPLVTNAGSSGSPSSYVDRIIKAHDRHIEDSARRAKLERKNSAGQLLSQPKQR